MKAQEAIARLVELKIEKEYARATDAQVASATREARGAIMQEAGMTKTEASDHLRWQTIALLATRKCQCRLISETCGHGVGARPSEECQAYYESDVPPAGPGKIMLCGTCYCDAPEEVIKWTDPNTSGSSASTPAS